MSGLFGGNGKGGATPGQINIPAFTSSGGITPNQMDLADFTLGQDILGEQNLFGESGTGHSTMATQGAEGAKNTEALQEAGMSDTNQAAQYQLYKNQLAGFEQGLSNDLAIQNANANANNQSLDSLATLAGFGGGGEDTGISNPNSSNFGDLTGLSVSGVNA